MVCRRTLRRRGGSNIRAQFIIYDTYATTPVISAANGVYSYSGNEMSYNVQLDSFQNTNGNHIAQYNAPISQANITGVGAKVSAGSICCIVATSLCGGLFIIPLCYMCCMWWKKIVSPLYELTPQFYQGLERIVGYGSPVKVLNLTVLDNNFTHEKAAILFNVLSKSGLTGFVFNNVALQCNHNANEFDDFESNMRPIKQLGFNTQIRWGDKIVT